MSKLDELIQELCPNGVESVPLWSVTTWDKKFNAVDRKKQPKVINYSYLLATDLFALQTDGGDVFLLSTGEQTGWTTEELAGDNLKEGEVVTLPWGKSRAVTDCIKYYKGKFVTADNRIATSSALEKLDNKYLYYWLMSQGKVIDTFYRGSGIKHPDMAKVLDMEIPLPPLPVQREIVRILDNFTEMNAELTAELTARKKQYAYYRDKLLHNDATTVYKRLGDFCDLLSGFPFDSGKFKEDGIRLMRGMNIKRGYLDFAEENNRYWESTDGIEKYLLNDQDIVISMDGSLVGSSYGMVSKKDLPLLLVQRVTRIRTNQANIRYVYHYIASGRFTEYVHKKKTAGAIPHISLKDISNFEVPLPSLEIQKRLVEVLDNFDAICSDLKIGLPAEIEARQKQYEYYRDKLLTFTPAD